MEAFVAQLSCQALAARTVVTASSQQYFSKKGSHCNMAVGVRAWYILLWSGLCQLIDHTSALVVATVVRVASVY